MALPLISVVIPTRNRREALLRLLRSLEREAAASAIFEVIVVDDGSSDGTPGALAALVLPFSLRVATQATAGPAVARNAGAAIARGDYLLFLDDDVEVLPGTLAAHRRLHDAGDRRLGLGDLPPVTGGESLFARTLDGWWLGMRDRIGRPAYRYSFRDVLTANLSIRRSCFEEIGGFDPALICHEDWDLGYRALAAGMEMRFEPDAVALHHDTTTMAKAFRRKFDEGVADVQLMRKYPNLAPVLPLSWEVQGRKARLCRRAAVSGTSFGGIVPMVLAPLLGFYERLNLRFRWRALLEALLTYWYWRGVASVVDPASLPAAVGGAAGNSTTGSVSIDLEGGLAAAGSELERLRPDSVTFLFGGVVLATIPAEPGRERLAARHLPWLIADGFPLQYQAALAAAGLTPLVLTPRIAAACRPAIGSAARGVDQRSPSVVASASTGGAALRDPEPSMSRQ